MGGDTIPIYGSLQHPPMDYPFTDNHDMRITDNISANLNAWMAQHPNMDTIKKVSTKSRVGFGTVQRMKNGDGNPTITNLCDIARAFGRRIEDLLAAPPSEGNVVALAAKEPAPPAYSSTEKELFELADAINEKGLQQLIGMAKVLAVQFPRHKKSASDTQ